MNRWQSDRCWGLCGAVFMVRALFKASKAWSPCVYVCQSMYSSTDMFICNPPVCSCNNIGYIPLYLVAVCEDLLAAICHLLSMQNHGQQQLLPFAFKVLCLHFSCHWSNKRDVITEHHTSAGFGNNNVLKWACINIHLQPHQIKRRALESTLYKTDPQEAAVVNLGNKSAHVGPSVSTRWCVNLGVCLY